MLLYVYNVCRITYQDTDTYLIYLHTYIIIYLYYKKYSQHI